MTFLQQSFTVRFDYKVFFTNHLFQADNETFKAFLEADQVTDTPRKILMVIDDQVVAHHPSLIAQIHAYCEALPNITLVPDIITIPGGETAKNRQDLFDGLIDAVNKHKIDRHSYLAAIGGGSVLDLAGYAAAVAHRGIRHIRIPTTVLSQNDSGVGVKNGVNYLTKKNFLGTFAPPAAVFNDFHFLTTLSNADYRSGMAEAIKVALIKDAPFFYWLEENAPALVARNADAMAYLIKRCAELHLAHIRAGDPFETGSSRPLDFGHWSAHKLEQLSNFTVRHGEAVAMGIALDSVYAHLAGMLAAAPMARIVQLIQTLGFEITHPLLAVTDNHSPLLEGLAEFREHLGGRLTIMLLQSIGVGVEVHTMDPQLIQQAADQLMHKTS